MPAPKKTISLRELGLNPEDVTRLLREGLGALSSEHRLKLGQMISAGDEPPAVDSIPLKELEMKFFEWLDDSTVGAKLAGIKAFNVCLGEGVDYFEADFFGCPAYDADDPDWACEWCHEGETRFVFNSEEIEPKWEVGLRVAKKMFKKYLGTSRRGAKSIQQVGIATIGFSDGDLNVVLSKKPRK